MAPKRSASNAAATPSTSGGASKRGRTEALWRLERAGFLMKNSTSSLVADFGLSFSEHTTLTSLIADLEDIPLTQTQLVELTGSSPSAMTSRIDRLEARGLVQREPDPRDRRATVVRLTPDGLDLVWRALDAVEEAQRALLKDFTEDESAAFVALLRKLTASLDFTDHYA
jgi:DNA-binding MarR family transcriptional regulator